MCIFDPGATPVPPRCLPSAYPLPPQCLPSGTPGLKKLRSPTMTFRFTNLFILGHFTTNIQVKIGKGISTATSIQDSSYSFLP